MKRGLLLGALVASLSYMGCEPTENRPRCSEANPCEVIPPPGQDGGTGEADGGAGETDGGTDGGTGETDGGTDGGTGETDGGSDGGTGETDAGTPEPTGPRSEWPTEELKNYSTSYSIPRGIKGVGIDDGHNIWVLETQRYGVLTSEKNSVTWVSGIGQLSSPELSYGATVICGGAPGKAYVGFAADDNMAGERTDINDPEFQKGDVDLVKLNEDGTISLQVHLWETTTRHGVVSGIRNSNSPYHDEDRTVLSCVKAYRGASKGEVFIGTNHGVTRIDGEIYNSHIHPRWMDKSGCADPTAPTCVGSQRAGYTYGLGIAQDGDVLIANDWHIGRVTPTLELKYWDQQDMRTGTYNVDRTPFRFDTFVPEVNSQAEFDFWRGIAETPEELTWNGRKARYMYLGNIRPDGFTNPYGLYRLLVTERTDRYLMEIVETVKVDFPHMVSALTVTDDGSMFIGTPTDGLYRMGPDKVISKVPGVTGSNVKQIVYDPTASPSMLLVLTNDALWVLRGH